MNNTDMNKTTAFITEIADYIDDAFGPEYTPTNRLLNIAQRHADNAENAADQIRFYVDSVRSQAEAITTYIAAGIDTGQHVRHMASDVETITKNQERLDTAIAECRSILKAWAHITGETAAVAALFA